MTAPAGMAGGSFARQVKGEILSHEPPRGCCAVAFAYGIACFGRSFGKSGLVLYTEMSAAAQYAKRVFASLDVAGKVYARGSEDSRIYEFAVTEPEQVRRMLALFGHDGGPGALRINSRNFACEQCAHHFAAAAFLACGTITNPQREYNLEFGAGRYHLAQDFAALLTGRGFLPKCTVRKGSHIVYFKASEQIEDMLTFMGAPAAAMEIMGTKVLKDFRNKANRLTNCETANIDKAVAASAATLEAIGALRAARALDALPEPLCEAARLREEYPDLSLKELAARFDPPLSKSGLSHRIKKLEQLAKDLRERNEHV